MNKLMTSLVLVAALACAPAAYSETTFGSSVTSANGQLDTTLTWQSSHTNCVGSGHPSWDGPKESSGTMQLPTIEMSGTYQLTLTCSTPASKDARLSWTAPTTNTDGSALTNLEGYRVHYGREAEALTQTVQVPAGTTTQTIAELANGVWFFAVRAFNSQGVESALSNTVSKTIADAVSESESVSLTVNPVPSNPTGLSVE